MEKKVFETPIATVEMFEESDILTLSPGENGNFTEIPW